MIAQKDLFRMVCWTSILAGITWLISLSPVLCEPAAKVGKVIALQGKVEIKRETEPSFHSVRLSEEVYERDTVRTGPRSKVKIFFEDESLLFLGENSEVQVKKFAFTPAQQGRLALIRALGGKVRFLIAKLLPSDRSQFELETTTAVMGVRGTDGIAVMKSPTQAICLSGEIYVHGLGRTREVILTPYMQTVVEEGQDPAPPFPVDMDFLRLLLGDFRIGAAGAGPGAMTDTILGMGTGWGATGLEGPGSMTQTIQTWGPDEFLRPPVLLEPPAGMAPPTRPAGRHVEPAPAGPPPQEPPPGGPPE